MPQARKFCSTHQNQDSNGTKMLLTHVIKRRQKLLHKICICSNKGPIHSHLIKVCTVLVLRMAHRIWKETKQHPGTAGPDNMLGCCLVSFHFLCAILSTSTVYLFRRRKLFLRLERALISYSLSVVYCSRNSVLIRLV